MLTHLFAKTVYLLLSFSFLKSHQTAGNKVCETQMGRFSVFRALKVGKNVLCPCPSLFFFEFKTLGLIPRCSRSVNKYTPTDIWCVDSVNFPLNWAELLWIWKREGGNKERSLVLLIIEVRLIYEGQYLLLLKSNLEQAALLGCTAWLQNFND